MRRLTMMVICVLLTLGLTGCRLNLIRLNKRLARWESMKDKADTGQKVRFASQSLIFFVDTPDLQRGRETLVSEAERLQYHAKMSRMQVFLIDYYASQALNFLDKGDWDQAVLAWDRADSLTQGSIPGHSGYVKLVLLQMGYFQYLKEISAEGFRYDRMERDFPGLMECLRQMSQSKFRLAEHYYEQGLKDQALESYLRVFIRDPENFGRANRRVKYLTGRTIREIYDQRLQYEIAKKTYDHMRLEMTGTVEDGLAQTRQEQGEEAAQASLPQALSYFSTQFRLSLEQVTDLYLLTKNEREGTLPEYLSLWRYQVLKGLPPYKPHYVQ